jgi:hypothetical protein
MTFDPTTDWFSGEGIPITPTDDGFYTNPYPMMRVVVRDSVSGTLLASTDIVLPVSTEMDCRACHAAGSSPDARPDQGWIEHSDPDREYRLNILRLHDDRQAGNPDYATALGVVGYDPAGLYETAVGTGRAVLCASCHGSNALPGTGLAGFTPLTRAVHDQHADALDPLNGQLLGASANRTACYRCHPGAATRCLRGAMGAAIGSDGELEIQCQSCHGSMSDVGSATRAGWFDEPTCQSCHTGTALSNNGQIRYTDAFDSPGHPRVATNATFATSPDVPVPGVSLYRFSSGHGELQCSACHGSTHAIFPAAHGNDNVQNVALQGHAGTLSRCTACHAVDPATVTGGPHGLHPIGPAWIEGHREIDEDQTAPCRACHGLDYRYSVLSLAQAEFTVVLDGGWGTKTFWRGARIGCYACHSGPTNTDQANPNHAATAQSVATDTSFEVPVQVALQASDLDADPLELRIVRQPAHGRVGLAGGVATYIPDRGFAGTDAFDFAAWDGQIDSNLGEVVVTVAPPFDPPPVPDGSVVEGRQVRVTALPGDRVKVAWDVLACPAPSYHLVWYDLGAPGSYSVVEVDCTASASGEWVGTAPPGNVAVVVVADDGSVVEGSHGTDSFGGERPSTAPACGFTEKHTAGVCASL